jgi:hypothetical protein
MHFHQIHTENRKPLVQPRKANGEPSIHTDFTRGKTTVVADLPCYWKHRQMSSLEFSCFNVLLLAKLLRFGVRHSTGVNSRLATGTYMHVIIKQHRLGFRHGYVFYDQQLISCVIYIFVYCPASFPDIPSRHAIRVTLIRSESQGYSFLFFTNILIQTETVFLPFYNYFHHIVFKIKSS